MRNLIAVLILGSIFGSTAFSVPPVSGGTQRQINIATDVVRDRMESSYAIPSWVLDRTKCLAALKVVKVGFIWGGEGSTGLVSCRVGNSREWSTPSFLNVGGVSFGLQIGIQFIESVVAFMTPHAQETLLHASVGIGTDLSFAAGPVGGGSGVGVLPNAELLTYDKSFGLFAGATINGFILTHGIHRNHEVYGNSVTPADLMRTPGKQGPKEIQNFIRGLELYAP